MTDKNSDLVWHKVLSTDELPEGRVAPVTWMPRLKKPWAIQALLWSKL